MSKKKNRQRRKKVREQKQTEALTYRELMAQGNFHGAAKRLKVELEREPTNDLRRALAGCLLKLDEHQEAAATLLSIEDKSSNELGLAGWCYIRCGEWHNAKQTLGEAIQLEESAEDYYWLAVAQAEGRERYKLDTTTKDSIIGLLEKAISFQKCRPSAFLWLEELQRWDDEGAQKRLEILNEALARHPESEAVRLHLAERLTYYPKLRNFDDALETLRPLLDMESPPISALLYAFYVSKEKSDWSVALCYLNAIKPDPAQHEVDLLRVKADTLLKLGNTSEAIACYREVAEHGDLEERILGIFGTAWARLILEDMPQTKEDAAQATELWFEALVSNPYFSFGSGLLWVQGESFDYGTDSYYQPVFEVCDALLDSGEALEDELRGRLLYLLYRVRRPFINSEYSEEEVNALLLEAAELLSHPQLSFDLAPHYAYEDEDVYRAMEHHLNYWLWAYSSQDVSQEFPSSLSEFDYFAYSDRSLEEVLANHDVSEIHETALERLKACNDPGAIEAVFMPFYRSFWRQVLFTKRKFEEVADVTSTLLGSIPETVTLLFDRAFSLGELGKRDESEAVYRKLLEHDADNSSALHNLSILQEEKNLFDEALESSRRAATVAPNDDLITGRAKRLEEKAEQIRRELERREEFLSTAPVRWPQLDYYKRQLLVTLSMIEGFEDWEHLSQLSGIEVRYLPGHYKKILDLGMIVEDADKKPKVNRHILSLIQREQSHAIATRIIHAEPNIAFKPIFNSRLEYTIYSILVELFPNHLIFPNMALQTIFRYDRMRELLNSEEFGYYLRSQVDFCITSTASYLPIIAFEVDSDYHDSPEQMERDRRKDRIFQLGGVPLLRLRAHGRPTAQDMRHDIVEVVRAFIGEVIATGQRDGIYANVSREVDFERFGLEAGSEQNTTS